MKFNYRKLFLPITALFIISMFAYSFFWFPTGYTGTTRKDQVNLGCVCHGDTASSVVNVQVIGPDSVPAGTTANFRVKISGGPAVKGGLNVASQFGRLDTVSGTGTWVDTTIWEITHTEPKFFSGDTVSWVFKYKAPANPIVDTLFASGNSVNGTGTSDSDKWNWSPNKIVRVYNPIGIVNISSIAKDFSLSQNYPNPFNPVTQINFSVAKASDIKIRIFDIIGNEISVAVNQWMTPGEYRVDFNGSNLSSGTYFYSLSADGKTISTKKMLMIK